MAALCLAFLAMKSWLIWKNRLLAIRKFHTSDYLSVESSTKAASCLYNRDHKLGKKWNLTLDLFSWLSLQIFLCKELACLGIYRFNHIILLFNFLDPRSNKCCSSVNEFTARESETYTCHCKQWQSCTSSCTNCKETGTWCLHCNAVQCTSSKERCC